MNRVELAGFISQKLIEAGIHAVLSGGSCVSIYSSDQYVSMDLDFVNAGFTKRERIHKVMTAAGFREHNRYFIHPDTELFIEFPPGPLAVGDEPVKEINEICTPCGTLKIISPTDCVKDRLTWFYHDDDRDCLEQALLVAISHNIDFAEVLRWSKSEGKLNEFEYFKAQYKSKSLTPNPE